MSRTRHRILFTAVLGSLAVAVLAGCSSPSAQENMDSACVALDEFAGAVAATRIGIDASSTIGEISAQKEQLREKYEAAQEALSLVEEDRVDTLTKAWNEFAEAVSQVDEDLTPGEAAASLVEEIDAIESAQNGLTDELTCS